MASKFGVPPMRPKDIVTCLAPLDISLDPENLENPHNLQKAYEVFIEWLMGVTRDELEVSIQRKNSLFSWQRYYLFAYAPCLLCQ
jgi:hypothetical protein